MLSNGKSLAELRWRSYETLPASISKAFGKIHWLHLTILDFRYQPMRSFRYNLQRNTPRPRV